MNENVENVKIKVLDHSTKVKNGVMRVGFAAIAIMVEIAWLVAVFVLLTEYYLLVSAGTKVFAVILVLALYSTNKNSAIKFTWIMLILLSPIFGIVLYLLVGLSGTTKRMKNRFYVTHKELLPEISPFDTRSVLPDQEIFAAPVPRNEIYGSVNSVDEISASVDPYIELAHKDKALFNISRYITRQSNYPLYRVDELEFYPDSLKALQALKEGLKTAEHFIFMEYHAIDNKVHWNEIQDILAEKAAQGVEVRVIYDDMGSFGFINTDFVHTLASLGIKCWVFNPMIPFINMFLNNRDHRKITVIDGKIAFSGGYNLVDYYFDTTKKYGHWKDSGIRLTGEAVNSMTYTFLEMWNSIRKNDKKDKDVRKYFVPYDNKAGEGSRADRGYIQPYADSPLFSEPLAENVYISIIDQAKDYIYLSTPYLIITDEMKRALTMAAKRGVDVRIVTPGIPDKKLVYRVTRSYYGALVKSGVRIFEYTPGFYHGKQCVSDDKTGVCGTINFDYRSLYHHFENACILYECPVVMEIKKDFEDTFTECREVTLEQIRKRSVVMRLVDNVLRLFAPMM